MSSSEQYTHLISSGHLLAVRVSRSEFFEGPIPHPKIIEAYERILPGSANRILQMSERQEVHRQGLESAVVQSNIIRERQGQWIGAFLAVLVLVFGFHLVNTGRDVQGFLLLIPAAVGLAGVFYYAQKKRQEELRERKEQLAEKTDDKELLPQVTSSES